MTTSLGRRQAEDLFAFAGQLADAAAQVSLRYFRTSFDVTNKHDDLFDPVTKADRDAETAIRTLIEEHYPEHGIMGEEHGRKESRSGFTWVVDPIDGTRAFITGSPLWGTLIALNYNGLPVIGVLDQPFLGERFWGVSLPDWTEAGLISRAGRRQLRTRACQNLANATLSTTTPEVFITAREEQAFRELSASCRLTRFGGDCYAYGLLAMGFIDLVVEASLQPYDIQALIPIVEGAGGRVTDWSGRSAIDGGRIIAIGDPSRHSEALDILNSSA